MRGDLRKKKFEVNLAHSVSREMRRDCVVLRFFVKSEWLHCVGNIRGYLSFFSAA